MKIEENIRFNFMPKASKAHSQKSNQYFLIRTKDYPLESRILLKPIIEELNFKGFKGFGDTVKMLLCEAMHLEREKTLEDGIFASRSNSLKKQKFLLSIPNMMISYKNKIRMRANVIIKLVKRKDFQWAECICHPLICFESM